MVVSVYREAGLLGVQVLLDAVGVGARPFVGLAIAHEVVIF